MAMKTLWALIVGLSGLLLVGASQPPTFLDPGAVASPEGYPVQNDLLVRTCGACHQMDEEGRMSRISFLRKTPEGWQASLQRMVALQGVRLDPATAANIVRYLSNEQGLAPEELRPVHFEVERRRVGMEYPDDNTLETCGACHSMGMAMTQRRSPEEWELLAATHQGYYPRVDGQRFRRGGARPGEFPVERALEHLKEAYPLETREWAEWSANRGPARIEGDWILEGWEVGRGAVFGRVEITPVAGSADEFTTRIRYHYPEDGETLVREGRVILYTGFQWRGRSTEVGGEGAASRMQAEGTRGELREVMFVERDWGEIHGRWFTGAHDEFGLDVRLRRAGSAPVVAGVFPESLRSGSAPTELRVFGAGLPVDLRPQDVELGQGVEVEAVVASHPDSLRLRVRVSGEAPVGARDLRLRGQVVPRALVVYDRVDYLVLEPFAGLARIGGIVMPKQYQPFEAIAWHSGLDGRRGTDDDVRIGRVAVTWDLMEYPVTFQDDDARFVGTIDARGLFTPGADGLNPERAGDRNNMGDVWVRARHRPEGEGGRVLEARTHLVVSAPLYMHWDNWMLEPEVTP